MTSGVRVNGIWQYRKETVGERWLEKKLHFNNTFTFKGGWKAGGSALFESFAFDAALYKDYALLGSGPGGPAILPFT